MPLLLAPPALRRLGTVRGSVTLLPTVEALLGQGTVRGLVPLLLAAPALLRLRAVCSGVTLLATVVAPVRLWAVVFYMALTRPNVK